MAATEWKELMTALIETSYERLLRELPASFEGLSKQQKKNYRTKIKIVRRRAAFDVGFGVAIVVGNGLAAIPAGGGVMVSAGGGLILFRKAVHVLIDTSSRI